jgi:hypothetical protein
MTILSKVGFGFEVKKPVITARKEVIELIFYRGQRYMLLLSKINC